MDFVSVLGGLPNLACDFAILLLLVTKLRCFYVLCSQGFTNYPTLPVEHFKHDQIHSPKGELFFGV